MCRPCEERLAWLTGFTGSAGAAIVLMERAVLFVDGRYTLQAREQVDGALFAIEHLVDTPPDTLDREQSRRRRPLGYDPWLHTAEGAEKLAQGLRRGRRDAGRGRARPDRRDLDATALPPPLGAVVLHDLRFAGEAAEAKLARIRAEVAKLRADALVVSDPQAVAWAFNIRGADVAHTPLPLAFAIVPKRGPAFALCRRPQARQRRAPPPRGRSPTCASRADFVRDLGDARQGQANGAARPGAPPPTRWRASSTQPRRQGRARAPIRSR